MCNSQDLDLVYIKGMLYLKQNVVETVPGIGGGSSGREWGGIVEGKIQVSYI
jgi:hypothetical protein